MYICTSFHQMEGAQRGGDCGGDVGAGDCDLPDGENDFLNLRI